MKPATAKNTIFRNYLYLIKPFWQHGKVYMLLMILPAILINPLVSLVDVKFTERFIDSILSQNWQAVLFTVLTLQGVYYLGYAVNDAVIDRLRPRAHFMPYVCPDSVPKTFARYQ